MIDMTISQNPFICWGEKKLIGEYKNNPSSNGPLAWNKVVLMEVLIECYDG